MPATLRAETGGSVILDGHAFVPIPSGDDSQDTTVHYGVGDIHGMRGLLDKLIALVEADLRRPMSGRSWSSLEIW